MINKINASETFQSQVELELLEALLEADDATYPWNPADDESEAYFHELEQQFVMQDLLDEELTTRSHFFYEQLDTIWSKVSSDSDYKFNTNRSILENLQQSLHTAFAAGVPQGWLNAIAQEAAEIFSAQQSIGDQLVQCVHAVLPTWAGDDLLVLARPFAYAMRSSEPENATSIINKVGNREWATLSEIEQARVSVAIAYYALKQLNDYESKA
jgi:hypothetical protein